MWFADKLGSPRQGASAETGLRNGKASAPQAKQAQRPAQQQARAPDPRQAAPASAEPPKKKKGWF